MKKGTALITLAALAVSVLLQACQQASANDFTVRSLTVAPDTVLINEKFSINAEIYNASGNEASYVIPILVNGIADDRANLTLAPGASQTVQFTLNRPNPGTYDIRIGDKTAQVTVKQASPAAFKIIEFSASMNEANPGQEVVIVARVSNIGGSEGSYIAELKVNDVPSQSEKIILPAGVAYNCIFKLTRNEPGVYNLSVDDAKAKFTVIEPIKVMQVTSPAQTETPYQRQSQWQKSSGGCCAGGGSCE